MMDFAELKKTLRGRTRLGFPMALATSYHIGGPAGALVEPRDTEDLKTLMAWLGATKTPYLVLGGGSNVLFADEGFKGVVIRLGREFQGMEVDGTRIRVKAATQLVAVLKRSREEGLGGVEFFAGIPGTLGGAVAGNAGAKKAWIGPMVEELTLVAGSGELKTWKKADYVYAYRQSSLKMSGNVLVEAVLRLKKEPKDEIEKKVMEYFKVRRGKQPRVEPNAGSVFKNPEGNFAGRLTESLGLKGYKVGGAEVSRVHANFIVNDGTATAHDVVAVMREIQKKVFAEYQIKLEPEILPLGDWDREQIADVFESFLKRGNA